MIGIQQQWNLEKTHVAVIGIQQSVASRALEQTHVVVIGIQQQWYLQQPHVAVIGIHQSVAFRAKIVGSCVITACQRVASRANTCCDRDSAVSGI